jgi:hypothetical protein
MINQEWKIKARAHVCAVTGHAFQNEEPFFTALFEGTEEEGFIRRDYSVAAWETERERITPFSYWRSLYEAPAAPPKAPELAEKAGTEALLRRLVDHDDPNTDNARFILAVMLERRKLLRETDQRSLGDARLRIYEHARTGEVFIIRDPQLRLEQIDSVQREVADLLGARAPERAVDAGASGARVREEDEARGAVEPEPGGSVLGNP